MRQNSKRRISHRYSLPEPLPVKLLLRSLSRQAGRGVSGLLMDASKTGLGILVQERVALASRCVVEVLGQDGGQTFTGEVCYATRTDEGIRLGFMLDESNDPSILEYLKDLGIKL